jgi:hypothetical protein
MSTNEINKALYNSVYNNNPSSNPSPANNTEIKRIIDSFLTYPYNYEKRHYIHQIIQKILNRNKIGSQGVNIIMHILTKINNIALEGTNFNSSKINASIYLLYSTISYILNKMWLLQNQNDKDKTDLCKKINDFIKNSKFLTNIKSKHGNRPNFFNSILLKCNDGISPAVPPATPPGSPTPGSPTPTPGSPPPNPPSTGGSPIDSHIFDSIISASSGAISSIILKI